jgi:hypothetical protein
MISMMQMIFNALIINDNPLSPEGARDTGVQLPSPPPPYLLAFDEGEMRFFRGTK